MEEKCPPMLRCSANLAILMSGVSLIVLVTSMPVLFTMMSNIEEELLESRINYEEMSNLMWKDLVSEGGKVRRTRRQTYKAQPVEPEAVPYSEKAKVAPAVAVHSPARKQQLVCPAGPKGAPGHKGPDGLDGVNGVPGKNGASGNGLADSTSGGCAPCPAGPPGLAGYKGKRGARGPKGNKGHPGPAGSDGTVGDPGPDGDLGHPGPLGASGPRGPPGEAAVGSAKGPPGPRGEMGPPGPPGDEGLPGERGDDMVPGPQGAPGPVGARGDAGPDGIPGPAGRPGGNGADAEYCQCPDRSKKPKDSYDAGAAVLRPATYTAAEGSAPGLTSAIRESQAVFDEGIAPPAGHGGDPDSSYSSKAKLSKRELAKALRRKLVLF